MSVVKDINDLPFSTKAIVLSIGGFMPLWFVILYYFFPNILVIGWYEKLMFIFVPTVIWFLLELGIMSIVRSFMSRKLNAPMPERDFWIVTALEGVFYLGVLALIAYYSKMSFESFMWLAFLFRFISLIIVAVGNKLID